jgi:hypothetical protein
MAGLLPTTKSSLLFSISYDVDCGRLACHGEEKE